MAIGFNLTGVGSSLIDKAVDYLGIPVNNAKATYTSRQVNHENFQLLVQSTRYGDFSCKIPSNINLKLESKYNNLLDGKLGFVQDINRYIQAIGAVTGSSMSLNTTWSTAMYWEGSSPVSLELPIELNARSDVDNEVLIPMRRLGSMVLPHKDSESDILLQAPGPRPIDMKKSVNELSNLLPEKIEGEGIAASAGNYLLSMARSALDSYLDYLSTSGDEDKITIKVGKILKFERCIIDKVDWNIDATRLLQSSGKPMRVTGNLHFITSQVMSNIEWEKTLPSVSLTTQLANAAADALTDVTTKAVNSVTDKVSSMF